MSSKTIKKHPRTARREAEVLADAALEPESLDIFGVSRITSMPIRTLRRKCSSGLMPAPFRPAGGRRLYWHRSDIQLWIRLGLPDRKTFERRRAAVKDREED